MLLVSLAGGLLTLAWGQRVPEGDAELRGWLENMVWDHGFSRDEVAAATGLEEDAIAKAMERFGIEPGGRPERGEGDPLVVLWKVATGERLDTLKDDTEDLSILERTLAAIVSTGQSTKVALMLLH